MQDKLSLGIKSHGFFEKNIPPILTSEILASAAKWLEIQKTLVVKTIKQVENHEYSVMYHDAATEVYSLKLIKYFAELHDTLINVPTLFAHEVKEIFKMLMDEDQGTYFKYRKEGCGGNCFNICFVLAKNRLQVYFIENIDLNTNLQFKSQLQLDKPWHVNVTFKKEGYYYNTIEDFIELVNAECPKLVKKANAEGLNTESEDKGLKKALCL